MAAPIIGLDFDGVICRPPLGLNIGIKAGEWDKAHIESARPKKHGLVHDVLNWLRYSNRRPLDNARTDLERLSRKRRIAIITGRPGAMRPALLSWLAHYELDEYISEIHLNDSGLPTPVHKLRTSLALGVREFAEDDGRTVRFLRAKGLERIFLVDWPRNRGQYPPGVEVVSGLGQIASTLESS